MSDMLKVWKVRLEPPAGVTDEDVREFINDAVSTWGGQCRPPESYGREDPGDPFWELYRHPSIKVTTGSNS